MPGETMVGTRLQEAIQETMRNFTAHFSRGDAAAVARLYAQDAVIMPPNQDFVTGAKNIEGFWTGLITAGVRTVALETKQIEQYGEVVAEIGHYKVSIERNEVIDEGKYLVLWKQENGEWKLFRDIWNSSRPLATP